MPLWPEDANACARLARSAGLSEREIAPVCIHHEAFREQMRGVDFLIAFKLHAAILAACYNVPFALVEYQPKCRDFSASLGWERFCFKPEELSSELLLAKIQEVEARSIELRKQI